VNAPVVVQVKPSEAHGVARLLRFQQSSERKTWLPCQHVTHPQWFALIGETPHSPVPLRRVQNLKPRECYLWVSPSAHLLITACAFTRGTGNPAPFYICLHSTSFCGLWRRVVWCVCTKISENTLPSFQGRILPSWRYKQYMPPKCWWPHTVLRRALTEKTTICNIYWSFFIATQENYWNFEKKKIFKNS
jgi:hypothetical protein